MRLFNFMLFKSLKSCFVVLLVILFSNLGYSNPHPAIKSYDFNDDVVQAYNLTTSLRFKEAYPLINQIKKSHPGNLATLIVEDYIDFLALMVSEDKLLFKKLAANKEIRLAKLQKFGNANDPFHLYLQAEIYLHWAAIDLRFGNYLSCLSGTYKSFKLLEKNKIKYPAFIPNAKNLGLMKVLVGTVPESYRSGVSFITGIDGSIEKGLKEIESVLNYSKKTKFIFENETKIIYAFLLLHINNDSDHAWQIISNDKLDYDTQPLLSFIYANAAYRSKNNEECIHILENRIYDNKYFPVHLAQLLLGRAKLNKLDKNANIPLNNFLLKYKGENFRKEANLLLYWYYNIFKNQPKRDFHYASVLSEGAAKAETDQAALQEIKAKQKITPELLKARLLFDGGYLDLALKELSNMKINEGTDPLVSLEYYYRLGRIHQQKGDDSAGIKAYQLVIDKGRNLPYYFACNAALQIAFIHEKKKRWSAARHFYNECLDIEPIIYKISLHGKAKAGLIRIKSY